ncbi:membrane-bound lytic murein transglycosylase MltF [Psychrosphaera sp.]|nr:membrane-bound lytic murein transglycosylase MltF [Psychrosphaera sp.]
MPINLKKRASYFMHLARLVVLCCSFLFGVVACGDRFSSSKLQDIKNDNVLKVGILFDPTSYYIDASGAAGFEYELVQQFGDYLDVEIEFIPSYNSAELLPKLKSGQVDIVVGGVANAIESSNEFRLSPPYYFIDQKLVFKQGRQRPKSFEEMNAPITVGLGTGHVKTLNSIVDEFPNLKINVINNTDPTELLEALMAEEFEFTIADSHRLALMRRYYPDISIAFTVKKDVPLNWLLPQNEDDSLFATLIEFFGELHKNGELIALEDKYFGHVEKFNYVDTRLFIKAIEDVLPKYKPWFEEYSGDLDWRLIAAQSYQESHWNPRAKSPTGVRGIMMLTQPTAKQMGVKSRLHAESNIRGGAQYLNLLMQRIPKRISESDRPWFALAAYNIGWGHVQDGRRITEEFGGDPDKWVDVKQHLPKLRQKKYYKTTRYGFARGDEAVTYVSNIRRYYDTLNWIEDQAIQQELIEKNIEQQKERANEEIGEQPANDLDENLNQ